MLGHRRRCKGIRGQFCVCSEVFPGGLGSHWSVASSCQDVFHMVSCVHSSTWQAVTVPAFGLELFGLALSCSQWVATLKRGHAEVGGDA